MTARRLLERALLAGAVAGMALCARVPAEGAGWRAAFVACALAAGGLVYRAWRRDEPSAREVFLFALLLRALVFPLPPTLSDDAYRYVWDGMVQAQEGINPYHYRPSDPALAALHDEPLYERLNSADYFSVYPPLSQLVFYFGGLFYPFGWAASFFAAKAVFAGIELAGVALLLRIARPRDVLLYAWHPLAVLSAAGQGHTEAAAVGLLCLAFRADRRGRGALAGAAVAAAGWVKLFPLVLLPFVVRRWGWRAAAGAALVSLFLIAPYAAPYTVPNVASSLALYVKLFEFNAGPYFALKGLGWGLGLGDVSKVLGLALGLLFLAGLPVLFVLGARRRWPLPVAASGVFGLFFVTATTVHPWYLVLGLCATPLLQNKKEWAWLGLVSLGTYLYYTGPVWAYPAAVWAGWGGAAALALGPPALDGLMRARGRRKWAWIAPHLPDLTPGGRLLDLGAGEGYVGAAARGATGAEVVLADVADFHRAALPFVLVDGRRLPFEDGRFSAALLVFVLHHAGDAEAVLREVRRVTTGRVVVVESVYGTARQRRRLERLDGWANGLRSGGAMEGQAARFRTAAGWRAAFRRAGFEIEGEARRGRFVHPQALFVLRRGALSWTARDR